MVVVVGAASMRLAEAEAGAWILLDSDDDDKRPALRERATDADDDEALPS